MEVTSAEGTGVAGHSPTSPTISETPSWLNYDQLQRYSLDEDRGMQSQSADCEPPPPPPHGSYTNLFDTSNDVPLGGSAQNMQRHQTGGGHITGMPLHAELLTNRNGSAPPAPPPRSDRLSPGRLRAAAPMAVPDQFSPSDPSPSYMYNYNIPTRNSPSAERSLASDAKYPTTQALITDKGKAVVPTVTPSSQPVGAKRSASQGSLNKQSRGTRTAAPEPQYSQNQLGRPGAGGDNIAAPTAGNSNNPPHNKVQTVVKYKESGYSSSSTSASSNTPLSEARTATTHHPHYHHHHNPHGPPAASVKAVQELDNVPGAVRRPMSFVKAVELSDALATQEREREKQKQLQHRQRPPQQPSQQQSNLSVTPEERHNMYGSSYEISV